MSLPGVGLSVLLAVAATCAGCRQPLPSITTLRGQAMGTAYTIKVVVATDKERLALPGRIATALGEFDLLFSTYNHKSEISRFNAHRSLEPFVPSPEFRRLVVRAMDLAKRTDGAFDPTVGPVLRLYGFGPDGKTPETPPTAAAIAAAREHTGWQRLQFAPTGDLRKEIPTLELDLNAIAKGAGVDVVAATIDSIGCTSYMVEIGGEVRCRGMKPDGKPWRLGVALPGPLGGPTAFADKVNLLDQAMATSGSYLQFRNLGEQRVHHIVDPRTGRNAKTNVLSVVSVTVIAKTCELADGLATALMVLGPDDGANILESFAADGVKALFLLHGANGIEQRRHRW
jgi:FAD:protein FMN transferase